MNSAPTYYVFFPVRDSVDGIAKVVNSLLSQTLPPKKIVIVDDGSTDGTEKILAEFEKKHDMITVHKTGSTTRDFSRLVTLWNMCLLSDYDYHMITAGDTIFQPDYAEKVLGGMQANPEIAIASGITSEIFPLSPHGAGRFVRQSFFHKFYKKYPNIIGYESEILFKAILNGYKTGICSDAWFEHVDQVGHSHGFSEFGPAMRALGHHPILVLLRVLGSMRIKHMGVAVSIKMLIDYVKYKPDKTGYYSVFPKETRHQVRDFQWTRFKSALLAKLYLKKRVIFENVHVVFSSNGSKPGPS